MIKLKDILTESNYDQSQLERPERIPDTLYHATFEEFVGSISKHGLVPAGNNANFQESDKNFVYLTQNSQGAYKIIEELYDHGNPKIRRLSGKINILTIRTKGLDPKLFFIDPWEAGLGTKSFMYAGKIPSKNIVDYGD